MGTTRNDINSNAFAVTPSDNNHFEKTRGVYVGVAGNLTCEMAGGNIVTFVGLAGGLVHPLQVIKILSTGTTALNIIGIT